MFRLAKNRVPLRQANERRPFMVERTRQPTKSITTTRSPMRFSMHPRTSMHKPRRYSKRFTSRPKHQRGSTHIQRLSIKQLIRQQSRKQSRWKLWWKPNAQPIPATSAIATIIQHATTTSTTTSCFAANHERLW